MDTTTAAKTAGVTVDTIRHWCRRNAVAAVKVAGRWVIDPDSLAYRITLGRKERPMAEITTETMVAIGGRLWQKGGKTRVYVSGWGRYLGLEARCYKSGNIAYAELNGERISNSEAGRLYGAVRRVWYDADDDRLHIQWGWSEPRSMTREEIAEAIFSGIRADVAAL